MLHEKVRGTVEEIKSQYMRTAQVDFERLLQFTSTDPSTQQELLKDGEYLPGVVMIFRRLYPKIPSIRDVLFSQLESRGYAIHETGSDDPLPPVIDDQPHTWTPKHPNDPIKYGLLSVEEPWHTAPYPPSYSLSTKIIRAAGLTDSPYYYSDYGSRLVNGLAYRDMRLFVEHFTTLDLEKWDEFTSRRPDTDRIAIEEIIDYCDFDPEEETTEEIITISPQRRFGWLRRILSSNT